MSVVAARHPLFPYGVGVGSKKMLSGIGSGSEQRHNGSKHIAPFQTLRTTRVHLRVHLQSEQSPSLGHRLRVLHPTVNASVVVHRRYSATAN